MQFCEVTGERRRLYRERFHNQVNFNHQILLRWYRGSRFQRLCLLCCRMNEGGMRMSTDVCVYVRMFRTHATPTPTARGSTRCECGDCNVRRHDGTENFACNTVIWFYLSWLIPCVFYSNVIITSQHILTFVTSFGSLIKPSADCILIKSHQV